MKKIWLIFILFLKLNEYVEDGYTVWVTKARGEKCTRCWKYRELNSDGICPDCVEAIK